MVKYGEERSWEEDTSEDEDDDDDDDDDDDEGDSDEFDDEDEGDEDDDEGDEDDDDDDEEGSEDGDSNVEDSDGDEEEEDSDADDDSDEDADGFQDEPGTAALIGSSNIVENYGIERPPGDDDDLEKGDGGGNNRYEGTDGDDLDRTKKIAFLLCCCVMVLAVIGIVLGVVVFNDDDDTDNKQTSRGIVPPSPAPITAAPVAPPPTPFPTSSPTMPIPGEINVTATADTFLFLSDDAEQMGPFGDQLSLLVQNDVQQAAAISLLAFDISEVSRINALNGWTGKATLVLSLLDTNFLGISSNATLETMRLPDNGADIEAFTSNVTSLILDMGGTMGPSIEVSPEDDQVMVDITSLVFGDALVLRQRRRRMQTNDDRLLLALMNKDEEDAVTLAFYSTESSFPPRLVIELTGPGPSPTISPGPTTTSFPSASPSLSAAPSSLVTSNDTDIVESYYYYCSICGERNITNPTAIFFFPDIGSTTCDQLQQLGDDGMISESNCASLQLFINTACCVDRTIVVEPFRCNICTDGTSVTNPELLITVPDQSETTTCGALQALGESGALNEDMCPSVQMIVTPLCCQIPL